MVRSGFKMKYSPAKGKLGDFFSSLGKQLKANRRDIGGEFKGVKQKDKARMLQNKADAAYYGSAEDKAKNSEANRIKNKSKGYYPTWSGKKGDKMKYRYKNDGSDFDYKYYEFQRDPSDPKYKGPDVWETSKTKDGAIAIHNLYMDDYEGRNLEIIPIQKKSKGFKMPGYGKRK